MNDIPLKQIIDSTLSQIGSVADVNTVIGDPITTAEGTTIIPFSNIISRKRGFSHGLTGQGNRIIMLLHKQNEQCDTRPAD